MRDVREPRHCSLSRLRPRRVPAARRHADVSAPRLRGVPGGLGYRQLDAVSAHRDLEGAFAPTRLYS